MANFWLISERNLDLIDDFVADYTSANYYTAKDGPAGDSGSQGMYLPIFSTDLIKQDRNLSTSSSQKLFLAKNSYSSMWNRSVFS